MSESAPEIAGESVAVAGRITPADNTLAQAIEDWAAYLRGRNRRPSSIRSMRGEMNRAVRALGWSDPADLTFASVTGWLASHEGWSVSTYNRNLSVFRSFARWAHAAGLLERDPLTLAQRAVGDGGPGARAATTDEARQIILEAWTRERVDRRAQRAPRSIYYACMFLAGCRKGEPALWRWSDLLLDTDPPVILWQPEGHKAGRREETAMAPELAGLLREWRDAQKVSRSDPVCAEVFPAGLGKHTFQRDRDRCGIPEIDTRGRSLTPHGARKWTATTLTLAGVHPRIIDRLMRHATGVQGRYVDAGLADQAAALALLPKIYPPQGFAGHGFSDHREGFGPGNLKKGVGAGGEKPYCLEVTPMNTHVYSPQSPTPTDAIGVTSDAADRVGLSALEVCDEDQGSGTAERSGDLLAGDGVRRGGDRGDVQRLLPGVPGEGRGARRLPEVGGAREAGLNEAGSSAFTDVASRPTMLSNHSQLEATHPDAHVGLDNRPGIGVGRSALEVGDEQATWCFSDDGGGRTTVHERGAIDPGRGRDLSRGRGSDRPGMESRDVPARGSDGVGISAGAGQAGRSQADGLVTESDPSCFQDEPVNGDYLPRNGGGSTFGVAGRDNRPTEPPVPWRAEVYDAPGERPGHPISRGGGADGDALCDPGDGITAGRRSTAERDAPSKLDPGCGSTPSPQRLASGFDSRPPHSALGDFLKAQADIDAASARRLEAMARLMGGER